jgi:hypothetical protein
VNDKGSGAQRRASCRWTVTVLTYVRDGQTGQFRRRDLRLRIQPHRQTARITLDQIGLLSIAPKIRALLNERDYGTIRPPPSAPPPSH